MIVTPFGQREIQGGMEMDGEAVHSVIFNREIMKFN